MGGVPVLLMVALLGITNAGHPDDQCVAHATMELYLDGSSESGIGSMFHEFDDRSIRVFNRKTPENRLEIGVANDSINLGTAVVLVSDAVVSERSTVGSSVKVAAVRSHSNDFSPVEIPQISCVPAEPRLNPAINSRSVTVRKPQNTNPPPSGFSFPSVPPSLSESAQTLAQNVDRAGRTIDPVASARGAVNGSTLPSTSTSAAQPFTVPPFTNSGGTTGVAASGASGPSTDPLPNRGTAWGQVPAWGTTSASTAGTSGTRNSNPNHTGSGTNRASSGIDVSPILATDTFGRVPSGLNALPNNRSAQPNYGSTGQPVANAGTPGFMHVPNTASIFGGDHSSTNTTSANVGSGLVAAAPATASGVPATASGVPGTASGVPATAFGVPATAFGVPATAFGVPATASGVPGTASGVTGTDSLPVGQPPISRFGANPSRSFTQPSDRRYPAGTTNTRTTAQLGFSNSQPDARLSSAQIAAGAWSVDAFGHPVDRAGQRIASVPKTTGSSVANAEYQRNPWSSPSSIYPTANASPINHNLSHQNGQPAPSGFGSKLATSHTDATNLRTAAISAPAIKPANSVAHRGQLIPLAAPLAPQSLFNGLLLISMVANIYLIFWLKNLRLQYHDMVAAKRMASSNASSN